MNPKDFSLANIDSPRLSLTHNEESMSDIFVYVSENFEGDYLHEEKDRLVDAAMHNKNDAYEYYLGNRDAQDIANKLEELGIDVGLASANNEMGDDKLYLFDTTGDANPWEFAAAFAVAGAVPPKDIMERIQEYVEIPRYIDRKVVAGVIGGMDRYANYYAAIKTNLVDKKHDILTYIERDEKFKGVEATEVKLDDEFSYGSTQHFDLADLGEKVVLNLPAVIPLDDIEDRWPDYESERDEVLQEITLEDDAKLEDLDKDDLDEFKEIISDRFMATRTGNEWFESYKPVHGRYYQINAQDYDEGLLQELIYEAPNASFMEFINPGEDSTYGIGLNGGGSDLSWDIINASIITGNMPNLTILKEAPIFASGPEVYSPEMMGKVLGTFDHAILQMDKILTKTQRAKADYMAEFGPGPSKDADYTP